MDGYISYWHTPSGNNLHSLKEINNSINSVCYSNDYRNYITAGNDISVRLYDENMKSLIAIMKPNKFNEPGHTGRIFCGKFFSNDTSTICSGYWDKTIQFYDARVSILSCSSKKTTFYVWRFYGVTRIAFVVFSTTIPISLFFFHILD